VATNVTLINNELDNLMRAQKLLEKLIAAKIVKKFLTFFLEPECSLPCSQNPTTCLYPGPSLMPIVILSLHLRYRSTGHTQKNGAVSKVNKKFMSPITRAQYTPSAAATVRVSHALPAVRFSCLLRGRGASFKDGVAAGEGFLCAPF
jgi:hypothetical protein